ncbi:MAG: Ldh family oxidoreductase [Chloroflexota bacterium]
MRITYPNLKQFFYDALTNVGTPHHVAEIEAEIGAEVDLSGVHSHGVRLLIGAIDNIQKGITNPNPELKTLVDFPASVLMETHCGLGRYTSAVGIDLAVERAEQYGIGCVTIKSVAHWGRAYSYALRAANAGMLSLSFTNAYANFPAWGTAVPSLGNNPIGVGIPAGEGEDPVALDIAMTQTAIGRVMDAVRNDENVPLGWGLDSDGNPTEDAKAIAASERFLPMGEHKGSGLSFVTDLLTGGLAGHYLCYEQGTEGRPSDGQGGSTKTFIAIKPYGEWLDQRVADLKAHLHSVPTEPKQGEALWPGEASARRRKDYQENGIDIPERLAADMDTLADELGVNVAWGV